jgi:hypothetical protein
VREFDSVHGSLGANDIGDVGNRSSTGGTQVQDLGSRLDVDVIETTQDTSGKLGSERVPHSVLDLLLFTC